MTIFATVKTVKSKEGTRQGRWTGQPRDQMMLNFVTQRVKEEVGRGVRGETFTGHGFRGARVRTALLEAKISGGPDP